MKKLMSITLTLTTATLLAACGKPNTKNTNKITIFHTNDTHSRVAEGKYAGMGFAKIGTILEKERQANPGGVLLMDAGDTFHGQTFSTINKGESILEIYNALKYDVMAPGNHDFNYGSRRLMELASKAEFKILAANVVKKETKDSLFPETTIITKKGIKIGVFGLATPETAYKTHPDNVKDITFRSPIEASKEKVAYLQKEKVNFIIAVGHIGTDGETEIKSTDIAENVKGIDLIIDGHSHTAETKKVKNTLIVQTGEYTKNLGKVDLFFDKDTKEIKAKVSKLISKESQKETVEKIEIKSIIDKYKTENKKITEVVVGHTPIKLNGERGQVRTQETNLGNLVADTMKWKASADFALMNGGGIRKSIDQGPITKGELIEVLPFGNIVVKLEVTGKQIKEALKNGLSVAPESNGGFPHISGFKVIYKQVKDKNEIISIAKTNGDKIEDNQKYMLATNDFIAAGGDKYTIFKDTKKIGEYNQLDEALLEYINRNGINVEVEGRITTK